MTRGTHLQVIDDPVPMADLYEKLFDRLEQRLEDIGDRLTKTADDLGEIKIQLATIDTHLGWHWKVGALVAVVLGSVIGWMITFYIPNQIGSQISGQVPRYIEIGTNQLLRKGEQLAEGISLKAGSITVS